MPRWASKKQHLKKGAAPMQAQDIQVERNDNGIFAHVHTGVFGNTDSVVIWSRVGSQADEYRNKSDQEIQQIVYEHWNRMNNSRLRRKKMGRD
jgi:hypothetical protein